MEVWLSFRNNEDRFQLPITPSTYVVARTKNNETVNINNLGDVKLIGKSGLQTLSIRSFFPAQDYTFIDSIERLDPWSYVDMINKWVETEEPIRVIFTETPINLPMSIESFEFEEKDGTGDVYFTLQLEEYIFLIDKGDRIEVAPRTSNRLKRTYEYTIQPNDTLYEIAKREYGKGAEWNKIYNFRNNNKIIGNNPNKLKVGLTIVIPQWE